MNAEESQELLNEIDKNPEGVRVGQIIDRLVLEVLNSEYGGRFLFYQI